MKTTKKLLVLVMVALIAAVSVMPSTFSWYSHNSSNDGQKINYADELPVSMKSGSSTISMSTVKSDANGEKTSTSVTKVNLAPDSGKAIEYYTTTFTNTGANDVMVDLEMSNLVNDADFVIGTLSPTLNEKAYASRATKTKVTNTTTRVYFKTHPDMSAYWSVDNGTLIPESTTAAGSSNTTTNDINIAYKVNGDTNETMAKMTKCTGTDSSSLGNSSTKVYYFDLPSNADYFYFFNHWYLHSASNREWNRTIDITDTTTKGRLYYLTGKSLEGDEGYKEYNVTSVQTNLVALNSYYSSVRMSLGSSVFADIGLKMESDEEDFIPEYYGSSITYKVQSGSSVVSVNKDGLITPLSTGTATIRTTITGRFGDTIYKDTSVTIPEKIAQVPVAQNILIPHPGATDSDGNELSNTVDVHWYVINKSKDYTMETDSIFFTI